MPFQPKPLDPPEPRQIRFECSPLALVVCQLRFEHLGSPSEEALRTLKQSLSDYPVVQPVQNVQIQVGPPGAQTSTDRGWRFSSLDEAWNVSVLPDSAALETTAYVDWEDFAARLERVIDVVREALEPRVEVRLGLRYVNEIRMPKLDSPAKWTDYLRPELVALTASELFAPAAFNAQQAIQASVDGDAVLNFRHGFPGTRDGALSEPVYLLDFDCYREGQRTLDVGEVMDLTARFNNILTSLFQWCISEKLWEELGPHDK
jgi:uncharacterized protein (TIGR04255 family)